MKTKWNLLIVFVLVAALFGATASTAQAARPIPRCVNPGDVNFWAGSGATFNICTNKDGVVDTYAVRMIRTYEAYYPAGTTTLKACKGTAVNFKPLNWMFSDWYMSADGSYTFNLSTKDGPWSQIKFDYYIYPAISPVSAVFDILLNDYPWQCPDPDAKLVVESETKINGTSLGIKASVFDHFDGDLFHDGNALFP